MRILLDECVPRRLKRYFRAYGDVLCVSDVGLTGYTNGQLLRRIAGGFDVFVTVDRSIQHQQNLSAIDVAFVLLRTRSNDVSDIEPILPRLFARWGELTPRVLTIIE